MDTLRDGKQLIDAVINGYFHLLFPKQQNVINMYMSTFRVTKFIEDSHLFNSWLNQINIDIINVLIVPAHLNTNHWALAVLHFKDKRIYIYDSLNCMDLLLF